MTKIIAIHMHFFHHLYLKLNTSGVLAMMPKTLFHDIQMKGRIRAYDMVLTS